MLKTQFLISITIYLKTVTTSTILQVILMLLLAVRLRCIIWDLSRSFLLRLAITIFSIILIYTMAQVNVVSAVFLCSNRAYPGILSFSSLANESQRQAVLMDKNQRSKVTGNVSSLFSN